MSDISTTYPSFGEGIADDNFIGSKYSVQDMNGIEVQIEERYAQIADSFIEGYEYPDYGGNPTWVKDTSAGPFRGNVSEVLNPSGAQLSGIIGSGIDGMESYGSGTDQVNYFFGRTSGVVKTNYTGLTKIGSTITSGYPTAINSEVTAIGWHVTNLLFSKLNVIYSMTTVGTETVTTAVTLTPGTVVKYIYSYSYDSVVVVTVNGGETYIYELEFTGSAYNIVSKQEEKDYECISAVGNKYSIYFISTYGIHQYQARQFSEGPIKYKIFSNSARIGWDRGVIVGDGTNLYRFRAIKPGRPMVLTKHTLTLTTIAIDKNSILVEGSPASGTSIALSSGAYGRTNTITLRPLDGGIYQIPKHNLSYRFGYIFPTFSSYKNNATRCGIKVEIMTDEMERVNSSNYLQIGLYETDSYGYIEILPNEIAKVLQTANYKSEFGYVRTRITLLAGDEYSSTAGYYRKTPKLFDFTISADFVKR